HLADIARRLEDAHRTGVPHHVRRHPALRDGRARRSRCPNVLFQDVRAAPPRDGTATRVEEHLRHEGVPAHGEPGADSVSNLPPEHESALPASLAAYAKLQVRAVERQVIEA